MNNSISIPKVKITQEDELNDINMADTNKKPSGQMPPAVTYNNPRRTSPENSITLRHHRMAREASKRNAIANAAAQSSIVPSTRRNSSDESNDTGLSDPRRWFDRSNRNLPTTLDSSLDMDPPFYQKETDSSNEEGHMVPSHSPAYRYVQHHNPGLLRPGMTHSSSADDFRSVIDDLTVENKRLKDELKRYRQMGPDSLRREKLFEVKVHGLPSRKKRELEAALRDFTTSLDGSSNGASPQRKREKTRGSKGMDCVMSKHASSSSGSNSRPNQTDSAYASMSTGAGSSGPSLPSRLSRQKSDNTVERYLQDIPEGLLPRFGALTEKEKKKLVVRRLEQIFTGKGLGHTRHNSLSLVPPPASEDVEMSGTSDNKLQPPPPPEASREAHILPRSNRASHSRDDVSPDSNDDRTQSRDIGGVSGSGRGHTQKEDDLTPQSLGTGDQRPTRPHDLDPDRPSVPSENMDYIRHLGLVAPESRKFSSRDVSSDAEGWVYLNLLCNMAQLHMFNVTPAFIRSAVSEKSRQFQLSSDGRKIRWRGGGEGTRFSSDSSGTNSRHGGSSPDTDGSNELDQRKRQKAQSSGEEVIVSEPSKFEPQRSSSSDEFHYKPMFAHHHTSSSGEQASIAEETLSSIGPPEESNLGINSRWNQSGVSRVSQRKRRRDGAIIYYTGAPFCTDLSGDFGNDSHDTNSGPQSPGPELNRSGSNSSIPFKPLSNFMSLRSMMDLDFADQDAVSDETDEPDEIQGDFLWSDSKQSAKLLNLEASGIGGITPDDHFVMVVSTSRPRSPKDQVGFQQPTLAKGASEETVISKDTTESIVGRLATMSTSSPMPILFSTRKSNPRIDIEYIGGKVRRLPSAPLPPPSFFFGDTSSSFETTTSDSESDDDDEEEPSHRSRAYSANGELSSNDEEDEDEDTDHDGDCDESDSISPAKSGLSELTGSSVATAGGAASGYSSMVES